MIILKRITKKDLEWMRKLRNANKEYFFDPVEITKEMQIEWYKKVYKNKKNFKRFYIIYNDSIKVGTISIDGFMEEVKIGNIIIVDEYRRKGILQEVIKHPYLHYKHIRLEVKPNNIRAIKAYEKCGFKKERLLMKKY